MQLAQANFAEAELEQLEAIAALELAKDELSAAYRQETLRIQALARQESLIQRGVGTESALEVAQLAAAAAQTATLSKRQALANANARITRAQNALARMQINRDEADRKLQSLSVFAEFDGVLSEVNAVQGGLVNSNERLGKLIDPNALEVSIRLSNSQFANLQRNTDDLQAAEITIGFHDADPISATIVRIAAAVGTGATGRQLFAKLPPEAAEILRPGDFVTVTITESALDNVALIPASAASNQGDVLIIGQDNRLSGARLEILRKQGDDLIVRPAEYTNALIVRTRTPQVGIGIKVEPRTADQPLLQERETVTLTPQMQADITASVENSPMPDFVKDRILKQVASGELSKETFDRLQSRIAGNGGAQAQESSDNSPRTGGGSGGNSGETVAINPAQAAKLLELLDANTNIPDQVKQRMITSINTGASAKAFV